MAEEKKPDTPATTQAKPPAAKDWSISIAEGKNFALAPRNFEEALHFAQMIAKTEFVPTDFRDQPGKVLAAIQFGAEVGLSPMMSLQSIAVVNGRPSLWGDGALAVVKAHPLCEWIHEKPPHEALKDGFGECSVKRRGDSEVVTRRFTKEMAEQAGLWGGKSKDPAKKQYEPWHLYPGRMLTMRARAWAMRDAIPEALRGMSIREEALDIEPRDVTPEPEKRPEIQPPQSLSETKEKERGDGNADPFENLPPPSADSSSSSENPDRTEGPGVADPAKPQPQPTPAAEAPPKSAKERSAEVMTQIEDAINNLPLKEAEEFVSKHLHEVKASDQARACNLLNKKRDEGRVPR